MPESEKKAERSDREFAISTHMISEINAQIRYLNARKRGRGGMNDALELFDKQRKHRAQLRARVWRLGRRQAQNVGQAARCQEADLWRWEGTTAGRVILQRVRAPQRGAQRECKEECARIQTNPIVLNLKKAEDFIRFNESYHRILRRAHVFQSMNSEHTPFSPSTCRRRES